MNHAYAVEKLTGYLTDVNALLAEMDLTNYEAGLDWPDWPQELVVGLPLIRGIVTAYNRLALAELHQYDSHERGHWHLVRLAVTDALGQAQSADELAAFLRPTSPSMRCIRGCGSLLRRCGPPKPTRTRCSPLPV